jgi:hypothetical protein
MTPSPKISHLPTLDNSGDWRRSASKHGALLPIREQPPVTQVNAFVDWLASLPLALWLDVGRSVASERTRVMARGSAWEELQRALCAQELQIGAWFVRDAVETAAFLASHSVRRWSAADRRWFAAAHGAAETAALALLARPFLEAEQFEALCEPLAARTDCSHHLTTLSPHRSVARARTG